MLAQRIMRAWLQRGPLTRALWPLSMLMRLVVALRRNAYARGWLQTRWLPVPVVVVGNLIVGGAGKTPTVAAIVALLQRAGWTPGIVSRGHGRRGTDMLEVDAATSVQAAGDEPLLLRRRCGCPLVVGRDRVAAGRLLLQRHPAVDVIVGDDGLQHLRLGRNVQVLVFDERGVGNGWLLPAGPLREPLPARIPTCSLVLYNANGATTAWPGSVAARRLGGAVRLSDWWCGIPASEGEFDVLRRATVAAKSRAVAVAGIARPTRFFDMLGAAGIVATALPLSDHHDYAGVLPWPADAGPVIVTEKDAVKLAPQRAGTEAVWVVPLNFELDAVFCRALLAQLRDHPRDHPHAAVTA